ncbi:uncharacterized protein V1518DRAFT_433152 [Limtongia smithiae]|uniref:uncharacterized protein n=1 Tax=Limtongia smithiae TaxID=1125753 RepID=UPI0034CFC7F2
MRFTPALRNIAIPMASANVMAARKASASTSKFLAFSDPSHSETVRYAKTFLAWGSVLTGFFGWTFAWEKIDLYRINHA